MIRRRREVPSSAHRRDAVRPRPLDAVGNARLLASKGGRAGSTPSKGWSEALAGCRGRSPLRRRPVGPAAARRPCGTNRPWRLRRPPVRCGRVSADADRWSPHPQSANGGRVQKDPEGGCRLAGGAHVRARSTPRTPAEVRRSPGRTLGPRWIFCNRRRAREAPAPPGGCRQLCEPPPCPPPPPARPPTLTHVSNPTPLYVPPRVIGTLRSTFSARRESHPAPTVDS